MLYWHVGILELNALLMSERIMKRSNTEMTEMIESTHNDSREGK